MHSYQLPHVTLPPWAGAGLDLLFSCPPRVGMGCDPPRVMWFEEGTVREPISPFYSLPHQWSIYDPRLSFSHHNGTQLPFISQGFVSVSELVSKIHHYPVTYMTSSGLDRGTPGGSSIVSLLSFQELNSTDWTFKKQWWQWISEITSRVSQILKHLSYWASHDIAQIFRGCKMFHYIHKGFVIFPTLRQCSNSHMLVHGLLHDHHLVYLIRTRFLGLFLDTNQNGESLIKMERAIGKSF